MSIVNFWIGAGTSSVEKAEPELNENRYGSASLAISFKAVLTGLDLWTSFASCTDKIMLSMLSVLRKSARQFNFFSSSCYDGQFFLVKFVAEEFYTLYSTVDQV
jgi:hypothetical protein